MAHTKFSALFYQSQNCIMMQAFKISTS